MSWYYLAIEIFCWVFTFVMLRHGLYRGKYLLHIFQQNGYKINEFSRWLLRHWNRVLVPVPHLAMLLVTLAAESFLEGSLTPTAITVAVIIFALFWFGNVAQYDSARIKKPLVFTSRMQRLAILYGGISLWFPILGTWFAFYQGTLFPNIYILVTVWVLADFLLPALLLLAAMLVYPLEKWFHYRFKSMARAKIESMPNLTVIGITGSYGKTSTKFLIDTVLKERFRVCTTPGSYNTPMGICKVINRDLKPSDQVLILEMGARYVGNIDELCRIARPDIAVVTNVGVAHMETFGSQEAIARTKAALVRHLKPGGVAVLNGDDAEVRKMAGRDDIATIFAGLSGDVNHIIAKNIGYDEQGCSFELHLSDIDGILRGSSESRLSADSDSGAAGSFDLPGPQHEPLTGKPVRVEHITMPLLGEHNVLNALLASGVGAAMGLRSPTISIALRKVRPVEHRLELKKRNGIVIIDDAFNSNPVGAKNAISVLAAFRTGRKFVVTPGMIELGEKQDHENCRFGRWMAAHNLDHVYLVGPEQTRPVYEGLREEGFDEAKISVVNSLFEANDLLKRELREKDVVLYENDLPDSYAE
ncbi:UDP-N-acetylmuramoyl-tripeptide--D-alanyl-D-alanine ligase [Balneolales bacterium ANBcel1]|nr:UDP-N-acetylmuramoyl-tripeptide--D-alanyl-D-alanine ligase [Balneolales bacterium ANBcel1]